MSSHVAIVKGIERRKNIYQALELIEDQIRLGRRIVVKPNLVSVRRPLATTHAEALDAVLRFIKERTDSQITVAEGCAVADAMKGFKSCGLADVAERHGARLIDLNRDRWVEVELIDRNLCPMTLRFSRTVAESDCRISLTPMKTHDITIVTLSLKNLVMGSLIADNKDYPEWLAYCLNHLLRPRRALFPKSLDWVVRSILRSDKARMHQTYVIMNYNLFLLAKAYPAHLAVLDGFIAMEGRGPTKGNPVNLGLAVASSDFIAADSIGARIMGFDPEEIGYLHHAIADGLGEGDLNKIHVVGANLQTCIHPFKPHPYYPLQKAWKLPAIELMRSSFHRSRGEEPSRDTICRLSQN